MSPADIFETLEPVLKTARKLGFLGPGPVTSHIEHALGFVEVVTATFDPPEMVTDLGTGGGVPGLVMAAAWPDAQLAFVEVMARRADFLRSAINDLSWQQRVRVIEARAEDAARLPGVREASDVVTSRSFAEPAATAEIGSAFVREGGILLVSEPPERDGRRWPSDKLASLSLGPAQSMTAKGARFAMFSKVQPSPEEVPRGVGRPTKRPLW